MIQFDFSKNKFIGVLALESFFPQNTRKFIKRILNVVIFLIATFFILSLFISWLSEAYLPFIRELPMVNIAPSFWGGILLLLFLPRLILLALDGFSRSKTYNKEGDATPSNIAERLNLYASGFWYQGSSFFDRTTRSLLETLPSTNIGIATLLRLGINPEEYLSVIKEVKPEEYLPQETFLEYLEKEIGSNRDITFAELAASVFEFHPTVNSFFATRGIGKEVIKRTAEWIEEAFSRSDLRERWWSKEFLGRIPGIGKDWAYGKPFLLEKFAYDLSTEALKAEEELVGKEREIELLEAALLKGTGANAVIVGEPGAGKNTVLLGLVRMILRGTIFPQLEHWRVYKLHGAAIIASGKTKGEVENLLLGLLNESVKAGNIIFVIDEFPEFIESLEKLGVNAVEVFGPYLKSPAIHILAMADTISFRRILEGNEGLMKYFERVNIAEPDYENLIEILKNLVPEIEASVRHKTVITYPALQKTSEGAINYLVEGALPKRAVDLLSEVAEEALRKEVPLVTPELVMEVIGRKTKMPLGEISGTEQEKLLKLEELLHRRVIDQEEAIRGITDAIKRARAGVRNPKRPIGSFLFLGPTGVGKTETSKALAEVYFGNEEQMSRFDMTEYQDEDALSKLIGSFEKNEPGILTSRMKASPYSVVLLDEFEKSHLKVKNLFLQILDEGFFSDYMGERVNMRNTIIIATSNAGSGLIWDLTEKGVDVTEMERQIIAYVQKEKILSPELLNRFDAIIIFRPLTGEMLKEIAKIMLERLVKRLKSQNMILKITDELIEAVAQCGYDPAFGARPMQRFIQDNIEKVIAEKIIKGEIKPGSEFSIDAKDLIWHK
jgi:ATP-dependent Clp protease ATP-binding subunit ClpC